MCCGDLLTALAREHWAEQRERGEVCIGDEGRAEWCYDYAHEAVQEDKLAMIAEVLDDYGADGLELEGIDNAGLDRLDHAFLQSLIGTHKGGPAGIEALAATLGEERDTLEDVVEPFLLQQGFVARTKRGRVATTAAYKHLGLEEPSTSSGDEASLF